MFDPWPLRHLVLRTPRLTLRPDDDEGLRELAALALRGVHPPEEMPFAYPWTDQRPADLVRNTLQYHWGARSRLTPADWDVNFLIRRDGRVIGALSVSAQNFAVLREVSSGSWLGSAYQRQGFGTEMRTAMLMLVFDELGARTARSSAFSDNRASLRISEKLGYCRDGTMMHLRRGEPATEIRLVLNTARFVRPKWTLGVEGLEECRELLGAG